MTNSPHPPRRASDHVEGRDLAVTNSPQSARRVSDHHVASRRLPGPWVSAVVVLAGVLVMLYPVLGTQYNNVKQREFATHYNREVAQAAPDQLGADLAEARAYNATLEGIPILDPWLAQNSGDPKSGPYRTYLDELSNFSVMARVRVPAAHIDLPVDHGTTDAVIARGAGHLYGTSLPVGGTSTHAVLTSHTGMATATLFDHLTSVVVGDLVFVDVEGETLAYQVDQIKIVLPNQIDDLKVVKGKDLLTLFTCTPYAINTHRLLVRGHRVPYVPAAADVAEVASVTPGMDPRMYGLMAGAAAGGLVFMFIIGREVRRVRAARVLSLAGRHAE